MPLNGVNALDALSQGKHDRGARESRSEARHCGRKEALEAVAQIDLSGTLWPSPESLTGFHFLTAFVLLERLFQEDAVLFQRQSLDSLETSHFIDQDRLQRCPVQSRPKEVRAGQVRVVQSGTPEVSFLEDGAGK